MKTKVQLHHHITGRVVWEDEIDCPEDASEGVRRGLAVQAAFKSGLLLRGANLDGANLGGAYLGGANLGGAYLGGANLGGAYLGGAYLGGANLDGANLGGANLGGAYLGGANLGGANLGGAYLGGAYLGGANLGGAYLGGANLDGANLDGAIFRDCVWGRGALRRTGVPITRDPIVVNGLAYRVIIYDRHAEVGCQILAIEEWAALTEDGARAIEGPKAARFWRDWREPLLALAKAAGRPLPEPAGEAAAERAA